MTALLPAEITSRRVVARYLNLVADGPEDPDALPDGAVPTGDVRFTRVADGRVWGDTTQSDGTTVRIAKGPIVAKIDPATGEIGLAHDPAHGVKLPVGLWSVEERVAGRPAKPWILDVTAGEGVIDLHTQAPVVPTPTTVLVPSLETMERAEAAADRAEEARDQTEATANDVRLVVGRKHPATPLTVSENNAARSMHAAAAYNPALPGLSFAIDHGWVAKSADGWATKTNGVNYTSEGWPTGHTPYAMYAWSDQSLTFISYHGVLTAPNHATPPTVTKLFSTPITSIICHDFYETATERIVLIGEYDHTSTQKNLYLSRDGGVTFTTIRTTQPAASGNNHWHAVAYDPWARAIWAAAGDNQVPPRELSYSTDWGATWNSITCDNSRHLQPTAIIPFATRVAFGRDSGVIIPGLDWWPRPVNQQPTGDYELEKGLLTFAPHLNAANVYFSRIHVAEGRTSDEKYVCFPRRDTDTTHIWATGDGGTTWHLVYTTTERVDLITSDGERLYLITTVPPRAFRSAPLLEWEATGAP